MVHPVKRALDIHVVYMYCLLFVCFLVVVVVVVVVVVFT